MARRAATNFINDECLMFMKKNGEGSIVNILKVNMIFACVCIVKKNGLADLDLDFQPLATLRSSSAIIYIVRHKKLYTNTSRSFCVAQQLNIYLRQTLWEKNQ